MRITSRGQVTIPRPLRKKTGLLPGTKVEFEVDGNAVRIRPARRKGKSAGEREARLQDWAKFVGHMRGKGDIEMTTDEIMALMRGE